MVRSYSVIVPVLNEGDDVLRSLRSITISMAFFAAHHPRGDRIGGELVVVDDGSTDATLRVLQEFARSDSRVRVMQHHCTLGIGPARNTGVKASTGDVLFFCDGDDLYFPEHLFIGFSILEHASQPLAAAPSRLLHAAGRGHLVLPTPKPLAAVRTGVRVRDRIDPFWLRRIANTIALNLCVRRECHEWIEGFPEEAVYRQIGGCEDVAYNTWLNTFFHVGLIDIETVEYTRSPGNSFDRQLQTFRQPPHPESDAMSEDERAIHTVRLRRERERLAYLMDKWRLVGPPRVESSLVNWAAIARAQLRLGRPSEDWEASQGRASTLRDAQGVPSPSSDAGGASRPLKK